MNFERTSGLALVAFAIAGLCGFWSGAPVPILLAGFLVLPGLAFSTFVREPAVAASSPGRFAFAAAASLVLVVPAVLPQFLFGGSLAEATPFLAGIYLLVGITAAGFSPVARERDLGAWKALAVSAGVLLPVVVHYSGGTVDDWWDLAFIRSYVASDSLSFAEPILATDVVHPRFAWNSWLVLQSLVVTYSGAAPEALHTPWLAAAACLLGLAAVDGLACAVFGKDRKIARYAAVLFVPAWAWGTEAAPYFSRFYQDKFVAGFVLAPTMVASAVVAARAGTLRSFVAFAITAAATVAVHGVVYAIAAAGSVMALVGVALESRDGAVRRRGAIGAVLFSRRAIVVLATSVSVAVYPLWQALVVHSRFAGQGISLSVPDNPVVRAHLALGRLVGAPHASYVVHPGAVFGVVAVVALIGAAVALTRRRRGDAVLVTLSLFPAVLIFVPGVVASVGFVLVPWMVYRVGWLVPVSLLAGRAFEAALSVRRFPLRILATGVLAAVTVGAVFPTAIQRLHRDMREHPGPREPVPRGTTLEIYEALRALPGSSPVIAAPGFSNLVPGFSGKPVLALSERGTLVFSADEREAYRRLRDRADFFSESTPVAVRAGLARAYGSRYAVFRRGYVTAGSDGRLFRRATAEGFLLSDAERGSPTSTASRAALRTAIPQSWKILVENRDFFLVETTELGVAVPRTAKSEGHRDLAPASAVPAWADELDVDFQPAVANDRAGGDVLASTGGFPGADYEVFPVPFSVGISEKLVWGRGNALWDDGPDHVVYEIELNTFCDVTAVSIIPYLPTGARRAFEVRVQDLGAPVRARRLAKDLEPFVVEFERIRTNRVRLDMRSLLGVPFGVADVRILGERSSCEEPWAPRTKPVLRRRITDVTAFLELTQRFPNHQGGAIAVASLVSEEASDDARAVLRSALLRGAPGAAAWLELGLLSDAAGEGPRALRLYRRARLADSNSAWARGCLAWAALRRGRPLTSVYEAWRATRLDPRYADAFTILAMDAYRLGAETVADGLLQHAMELDPRRSWPFLVAGRRLAAAGKGEEADLLIREYLTRVPDDTDAVEFLDALRAGDDSWREG